MTTMQAAVAARGSLTVEHVEEPTPGQGQVLVASRAAGICGSDLHLLDLQRSTPDLVPPIVLGHEFCAELLEAGPATEGKLKPGTLVCSVPFVDGPAGPELVGLSWTYPGALGERFVLQERRLVEVPHGLDARRAALAEPLAVGMHAVGAANVKPGDVALVVGCGPVGLAVISALKLGGAGPVVASDLSAARRALAERAGADVVVDPAATAPYEALLARGPAPLPPSPLLDAAELRTARGGTVVFDCVGVPGLLSQHIAAIPQHSRIVVAGVCHHPDTFVPLDALQKELTVQFVFAYRPEEFHASLHHIAEGRIDVEPWITSTRPLSEVAAALDDLAAGGHNCKVVIEPPSS